MSDRPVTDRAEDVLGRWGLAKTIFDLISSADTKSALRIGVYGRWGEGKTSVLRFVETQAKRASLPVCWFSVWSAQTQQDLWAGLIDALAPLAGHPDWRTNVKMARAKWFSKTAAVADAHPYAKAAHALAGLLSQDVGAADVQRLLAGLPAKNRIVILVDDVDRVEPTLVPKLLMGLHDLLDDVGQCAVVIALDPDVVAAALEQMNPAWGGGAAFIEKIVQHPFWLSRTTDASRRRLLAEALGASHLEMLRQTIHDLVHLLPSNPRQLKQFVRRLERQRATLARFGTDELNPTLIVLLELLRSLSADAAERLLNDDQFLTELVAGGVVAALEERDESLRITKSQAGRLDAAVRQALPRGTPEQQNSIREGLARIVSAAEEALGLVTIADAQMHVALDEAPPVMTFRELETIHEQWREEPTSSRLENLLAEHGTTVGRAPTDVLEACLALAIRRRGHLLDEASEALAADDAVRLVDRSDRWLALVEQLIDQLGALGEHVNGRIELFLSIRTQTAQFANRLDDDAFAASRARQRELLYRAASHLRDRASDVMKELKPWDARPSEARVVGASELNATRARLHTMFEEWVAESVLERFSRASGIATVGNFMTHPSEIWVLTTPDGVFHQPAFRTRLNIALESGALAAAENALVYLRMLLGADGAGTAPSRLARDKELVVPLWTAASRIRPQPKAAAAVRAVAEGLRAALQEPDAIALPQWLERETLPEEAVTVTVPVIGTEDNTG